MKHNEEINNIFLKLKKKGFIPENYEKADYSLLEREFHREIYFTAQDIILDRLKDYIELYEHRKRKFGNVGIDLNDAIFNLKSIVYLIEENR